MVKPTTKWGIEETFYGIFSHVFHGTDMNQPMITGGEYFIYIFIIIKEQPQQAALIGTISLGG